MKNYLFDFDGTLVDSMPTFERVMKDTLDLEGIPYGNDIIKIITPLGYDGTAEYFITLGHSKSKEELVRSMKERAEHEYRNSVMAKPHVEEKLRELKRLGHSLNVLTASPHEMLDPCLERLGIFSLFDNVWSCNDFGTSKSDPEIYKSAAKRLGVKTEDIIFLDDNVGADRTAKAAGCKVIGVFDESSAEYEAEMRSVCDEYIRDFTELKR